MRKIICHKLAPNQEVTSHILKCQRVYNSEYTSEKKAQMDSLIEFKMRLIENIKAC